MAEEKKPKIDLKARLGKTQVGAQTPAPPTAGIPAPTSSAGRVPPPAPTPGGGLPVPPGVPVGPPPPFAGSSSSASSAIDPSNPLAAVATPYRAPAPPPPPQAQRIEVDEAAVQEARRGARKMGILVALILGVAGIGVGWVAGGANSAQTARQKSKGDAQELAGKVDEAKTKIKLLNDKIEAGRGQLLRDRKYPTGLAKELGGINVDFDGSQLAGRRFSGFSSTTTQQLVDFIQSVQALNDRKLIVQGLLTRLEKPITEQFSGAAGNSIALMVVGTKDGSALLYPLKDPIVIKDGNVNLPNKFVFNDNGNNTEIQRYNGGDIGKGEGFAVTPASFNKVCPSETSGQIAQLGAQLGGILRDIQGEKAAAGGDVITEEKPGMLERADTLANSLRKVE
jgi:hypothetical protein